MIKMILFVFAILLNAQDIAKSPPLFGKVVRIDKDDILNVRIKPDYHSAKLASLPLNAYVGIDNCKKIRKSIWCQVHHLPLQDYEGYGYGVPSGWVNARFLDFDNTGYVLVDHKASCDYVVGCDNGFCKLVTDIKEDSNYDIVSLKTKLLKRDRLFATNHFGAMYENGDGYCIIGRKISDFFDKQQAKDTAKSFFENFDVKHPSKIAKYIHPKLGVMVAFDTHFISKDKIFTSFEIETMDDVLKILWGYEVNEEPFNATLYGFLKTFKSTKPLKEINKLDTTKGFGCDKCIAYEFLQYDKAPELDFSWQGMVIVLKRYDDRWYVVGLLKDRWSI